MGNEQEVAAKTETEVSSQTPVAEPTAEKQVSATPPPFSLSRKREEMYKKYDVLSGAVQENTEASKDGSASQSETVKPDSSSETEVRKPVSLPTKQDPKVVPKQALDQEREKRKQANLKVRELESLYKTQLEELKAEIQKLKTRPNDEPRQQVDSEYDDVSQLKRRLQELEEKDKEAAYKRQEEENKARLDALKKKIDKTDAELKESGLPGFKVAVNLVSEAVEKRFQEGDFTAEDREDPENWKKVYMEDVYPLISEEFKLERKNKLFGDKKLAKSESKVIDNPGSIPGQDEPAEELDIDQLNLAYVNDRKKRVTKMR